MSGEQPLQQFIRGNDPSQVKRSLCSQLVHRGSRPSDVRFAHCYPLEGVSAPPPNYPKMHRKFLCFQIRQLIDAHTKEIVEYKREDNCKKSYDGKPFLVAPVKNPSGNTIGVIRVSDSNTSSFPQEDISRNSSIQELWLSHESDLKKFISCKLAPDLKEHIDDFLHDTYIAISVYIFSFRGNTEPEFRGWLKGIAKNKIRTFFTKRKRESHFLPLEKVVGYDGDGNEQKLSDCVPFSVSLPGDHLQQKEIFQLFRKAIDSLSEKDKQIIFLRVREGKSHEEIMDIMKYKKPGAVRIAFFRAIKRLRQLTEQYDLAPEDLRQALRENDIWDNFLDKEKELIKSIPNKCYQKFLNLYYHGLSEENIMKEIGINHYDTYRHLKCRAIKACGKKLPVKLKYEIIPSVTKSDDQKREMEIENFRPVDDLMPPKDTILTFV